MKFFKKINPIFFILLAPIVILCINDNSVYPTVGYLDEWIYYGYSRHYDDPSFYPSDYKISRLPWILYLYGMRSLIPIQVLNSAIQLGLIIPTLFYILKNGQRLFGLVPACYMGIFLVLYPIFFSNGGAYYNNTLAGLLYAVVFYLVTSLAKHDESQWFQWINFGIFVGLLIHTNIMFLNLIPVLFIQYYFSSKENYLRFNGWHKKILLILFGIIIITGILGTINKFFGRDFFFYLPIFKMALSFVVDNSKQKDWYQPFQWGWYSSGTYLITLLGICLFSILALFWNRNNAQKLINTVEFGVILQFIYLLVVWHFWQLIGQTSLFPFDYFVYPLIIPGAYCIGASIALIDQKTEVSKFLLAVGVISAVLIFYLFINLNISFEVVNYFRYTKKFTIILLFMGVFVMLYALKPSFFLPIKLIAFGVWMSMIAVYAGMTSNYIVNPRACNAPGVNFKLMEKVQEIIKQENKTNQIYLWFDKDEKNRMEGCAKEFNLIYFAMSLGQTGYSYLNSPWAGMPDIENLNWGSIKGAYYSNLNKPITIVALSMIDGDIKERFLTRLKLNNFNISGAKSIAVSENYLNLYLTIATIAR